MDRDDGGRDRGFDRDRFDRDGGPGKDRGDRGSERLCGLPPVDPNTRKPPEFRRLFAFPAPADMTGEYSATLLDIGGSLC